MRMLARSGLTAMLALVCVFALGALSAASALAAEGEGCPNEQVRRESNVNPATGQPYDLGLPECRAYEMVSPVEKAGHNVELGVAMQSPAAAEGDAVVYVSQGEFAEPEGGSAVFSDNNYLGVGGTSGWSSLSEFLPASISPSPGGLSSERPLLFSPDLSRMATCGAPGEGSSLTEPGIVCALREPDGSWVASPVFPDIPGKGITESVNVYGASSDLSRIFFILAAGRLLPADTETGTIHNAESGSGIYEVAGLGTGGPVTLRLVNVDNEGVEIGSTVPLLGNSSGGNSDGTDFHAISEDGETVYFEATPNGGVQTLYARVDAAYTVPISEPSSTLCIECQTARGLQASATFQGASADGSKVFFTTEQELLSGHTTNNLYEYNADAPAGYQISDISGGGPEAEVQGVLRNSDDGSHVYFVARGVLTGQPNAQGQEAQLGADNLYVYERDSEYPAGRTVFIAMLCSNPSRSGTVEDEACEDSTIGGEGGLSPGADEALWHEKEYVSDHAVDVTKNGDYMDFETWAHLLPEDTNAGTAIYRYDASTGQLTWVSRPADGFSGHAGEGDSATISALRGTESGADPDVDDIARSINEDGEDVIFVTKEKLQADDVNEENDVYLWHDGTVSMISDGHDYAGTLTTMSASGSDIYIQATEKLVGQDIDQDRDVYDARVDGGYPAPIPAPPQCGVVAEGEACQGAPSTLPVFGAPGSVTFTGGANLTPPAKTSPSRSEGRHAKQSARARKFARALKACRKKPRKQRATCEKRARKRFGKHNAKGRAHR